MSGLSGHRCSGLRNPQPTAFLRPASPQGRRPSEIAHRPAQSEQGCGAASSAFPQPALRPPSPKAARVWEGGSSLCRHRRGQAGR